MFAEGKETEKSYLRYWERKSDHGIQLAIDKIHGKDPKSLVRKAKSEKGRSTKGSSQDEFWCVFDVDEHATLNEAIVMARDNDINVAVSNPCIELWFLLHFEEFQKKGAEIDGDEAQSQSKRLLRCGKNLSAEALAMLDERYSEAKASAQWLDDWHEDNGSPPRHNPSSNLWELIDRITGEAG